MNQLIYDLAALVVQGRVVTKISPQKKTHERPRLVDFLYDDDVETRRYDVDRATFSKWWSELAAWFRAHADGFTEGR